MTHTEELHVVFGATGGSGRAVVHELIRQGKRVRAINRSGINNTPFPSSVEWVQADAADPVSTRAACRGATVVYHCVGVPLPQWCTHLQPILHSLLEGAASAGAKLIFADNAYMYGKVTHEFTESLPDQATGRKGRLRAQMAQRLLQAHQQGRVRVAIARAADFYGPGVHTAIANELLFQTAILGKPVKWVGKLDVPHSLMFIDDFAKGMITLGEHDDALGQIWHLPHAPAITAHQFLQLIFAEVGQPPKIRSLPRAAIQLIGLFDPTAREFLEFLYLFETPFVMDSSKYQQRFGGTATPYREGIRQTFAALEHNAIAIRRQS